MSTFWGDAWPTFIVSSSNCHSIIPSCQRPEGLTNSDFTEQATSNHISLVHLLFNIDSRRNPSNNFPYVPQLHVANDVFVSSLKWWRHQMETFSELLAICAENSPVPGEFPAQRPVTRSFDVFFNLRLNKQLSKQSWSWWFETLSRPLWRHCNGSYEIN